MSRTTSGNVTVNGTIMHIAQDDLPFGGVGASGMGAYHGIEGFRTLSHAKGIYEQGHWNLSNLLHVPFRQPQADRYHPQNDAPVISMPSSNQAQEYQHMTTDTSLRLRGACECGACSFEVHTSPKARFRCHCLICGHGRQFTQVQRLFRERVRGRETDYGWFVGLELKDSSRGRAT
nr:hypothetical protein [Rhizobium leguminosarum]